MLASENEFQAQLSNGQVWKFRANQLAYCQLERLSGLPLSLAISPKIHDDPTDPEKMHVDNSTQLRLLFALSASHRAREGINIRFDFDPDKDIRDGYRGPYFTELVPTRDLLKLNALATAAVRADFGRESDGGDAGEDDEAADEGNEPPNPGAS